MERLAPAPALWIRGAYHHHSLLGVPPCPTSSPRTTSAATRFTYTGETSEKLKAAYFVQDDALIVFKNHDHKVTFAAHRNMVISVRDTTDDEAVAAQSEQTRDKWVDYAVVDFAAGTIALDGETWPYAMYTVDVRIPVLKGVQVVNEQDATRYVVGQNF